MPSAVGRWLKIQAKVCRSLSYVTYVLPNVVELVVGVFSDAAEERDEMPQSVSVDGR